MNYVQLNYQTCRKPSNMRPSFKNIDCQSLINLTDAHSGWLRRRDKSSKWLKKFIVFYRGYAYIFKTNLSIREENDFSLYGYLSCSAERSQIEQREGLWIIKIIPAENIKKQSRYFALSSEGDFNFWTDHFSKELQMAGVQKNTKMIKDSINYNSKMTFSSVNKTTGELPMKRVVIPNNEKDKMNNLTRHATGISEGNTTDTLNYILVNKNRSGVENVWDCLGKECIIFFMSAKVITVFASKLFLTGNAKIAVVEKGPSVNDRVLVQNVGRSTTKDRFKCFVKTQCGKDVHGLFSQKSGMTIFELGNFIDFTAVEQECKKETLDSNYLINKLITSFKNILVKGYENGPKKDLLFYFDNARQSGGEDVDEVRRIDEIIDLEQFVLSNNYVCKRRHSLKGKTKAQMYHELIDRSNETDFLTERKSNTKLLNGQKHCNYDFSRSTTVTKNNKRKFDTLHTCMPNSPTLYLPYMYRRNETRWNVDSFVSNTKIKRRKIKEDIKKINNSPVRENLTSVNAEGNTTLLHTSTSASEGNENLVQDVNVPTFKRASFTRRNRKRKKGGKSGLVKSLSKTEENFLVFYNLCVLEAPLLVQLYLSRKVPESTLAAHLESFINDLKFSRWKCTKEQLDLLFPAASGTVCSRNFDFSLVYKLIRNTLPLLSSPTRGWGSKPLPGDITELDDIERIRYYRTLLANNTQFKLKNSEFKHLMTDLYQAITRLSFGKLAVKILNPPAQKELTENIRMDIEKIKDEMNTLHRDMFEGKDRVFKLQESVQEKTDQLIAFCGLKTVSDSWATYIPILKEHHTFDIPLGAKKRVVRDCTIIPGGGWIVSDYNNSEFIMNGLCRRIKLSKPTFVTCIDGNIAVACASEKIIQFLDLNTLEIKKEIQTVETVFGMTNTRAGLLVRAGNAGCRFISSSQSDKMIPINGDNMLYIAVWEDNIFLTNWKSHKINCYNTCGVLQWSFTNENMRSPNGVTTDKEGNVFVVGTYSHNILILSKNYKETNTYWFEDAEMRYPIAIDYDHIRDKLVVCNMKGTVKVFDVRTRGHMR